MTLRGLISALPDAATATLYAICWFAPATLGYDWIKTLMLVMLIEFLVVHSGGFIGQAVLGDAPRSTKIKAIVGFGAFYMLFVLAFCAAVGEWWPIAAFGWLLVGKFLMVVLEPKPREEERQRLTAIWAASVVAYLFAVFATVLLPVPEFGIDAAARAGAAIPGSGLWVEQPETVIAAGLIYFSLLAWVKASGVRMPVPSTRSDRGPRLP
jgi:hypothetical protein